MASGGVPPGRGLAHSLATSSGCPQRGGHRGDRQAPPPTSPGCPGQGRGLGVRRQAAATPRPGLLNRDRETGRQGDRDRPRREGAGERAQEEERERGKRGKEDQASPIPTPLPPSRGTESSMFLLCLGNPGSRALDKMTHGCWLLSAPQRRPTRERDCSQAPSHCPIVQRPREEKVLARAPGWWEKGSVPSLP